MWVNFGCRFTLQQTPGFPHWHRRVLEVGFQGSREGVMRTEGKVALTAKGMGTDEFPAGYFR